MNIIVTTDGPFYVPVPEEYRDHELVAGRVFYTLPPTLLDLLVKTCGEAAFDPDALQMERVLSAALLHDPQLVGYTAAGDALSYAYLSPDPLLDWDPSDDALRACGLTRQKFAAIIRDAQEQLAPQQDALRGYLGWLSTNPQYLQERDRLFSSWAAKLKEEGIPRSGPMMTRTPRGNKLIRRVRSARRLAFLKDFEQFYARWRLRHLVTPELPQPLGAQIPLLNPLELFTQLRRGAVSFYQPDTVPIPDRDRLRSVLEDLRTQRRDDHLREWTSKIRRDRRNNDAIEQFANVFRLQHCWAQLERRHPGLLRGRIGKVHEAFAAFLKVGVSAVEKYRGKIRRRLHARQP
jgi:hypothetical protein